MCDDLDIVTEYDEQDKNYHKYSVPKLMLCETNKPKCTKAFVFDIMLKNTSFVAPTADQSPVVDCKESIVDYLTVQGTIKTKVNRAEFSATNYTTKQHDLYPGKVERKIIDLNGKIYITTYGEGTGGFAKLHGNETNAAILWSSIDGKLQQAVKEKLTSIQ